MAFEQCAPAAVTDPAGLRLRLNAATQAAESSNPDLKALKH